MFNVVRVAMLKKRISEWRLDKKNKEQDMLSALRIALQREDQGKKSVFLIRDREITFEEIKHYFRRKGIRNIYTFAADSETNASVSSMSYYTPPPTPTSDDLLDFDSRNPEDITEEDAVHQFIPNEDSEIVISEDSAVGLLPASNGIDPVLHLTLESMQLQQLLVANQIYYRAIFEIPDWRDRSALFDLGLLERFYHDMFEGQSHLEREHWLTAFTFFDRAFGLVHDILTRQILLFLPYLYHLIINFQDVRNPEVICRLLDFFSRMSGIALHQNHPIKQTVAMLGKLSTQTRVSSARCVFESTLTHLQTEFEPVESEGWSTICSSSINRANPSDAFHTTAAALGNLFEDLKIFNMDVLHCGRALPETAPTLRSEDMLARKPRSKHSGFHHDLKPDNILWFSSGGQELEPLFKITDFGLGKIHSILSPTTGTAVIMQPMCHGQATDDADMIYEASLNSQLVHVVLPPSDRERKSWIDSSTILVDKGNASSDPAGLGIFTALGSRVSHFRSNLLPTGRYSSVHFSHLIVKGSGRGGQYQQQPPALGEKGDFAVHFSVHGKV
jgi:serine/threonine protein kinase